MKATFSIETIIESATYPVSVALAQLRPAGLSRERCASSLHRRTFTTALLFLASFTAILILSIAILNYIGNRREKQRASLLALVKHITLKRAMVTEFRSIAAGDSLGHAAQIVMHTLQNYFPVVEGERPVGSLSRSTLFSALERQGPDVLVRDIMHAPALQAEATETVSGALRCFHHTSAPFLWVLENATLVGLITPASLEQYLRVRAAERRDSTDASQPSSHSEAQNGKAQRVV